MNQYPGMPPAGPVYPGQPHRRQDPHFSPSPHPQFIPYYAPASPHPGQIPYGPPPQFIPQWFPYQQYPYPGPIPQQFPPQPPPQQRHHPQHSPLVVSSTNQQPVYPHNRQPHPQSQPQPPAAARTPFPGPSTPSTTSQPVVSPSVTPLTASDTTATPPIAPITATPKASSAAEPSQRKSFTLELPWYSMPQSSFPPRAPRRRRKRRSQSALPDGLSLPTLARERATMPDMAPDHTSPSATEAELTPVVKSKQPETAHVGDSLEDKNCQSPVTSTIASGATVQTAPQEQATPKPMIPAIPVMPRQANTNAPPAPVASNSARSSADTTESITSSDTGTVNGVAAPETGSASETVPEPSPEAPKKAPPKSWAELLRNKNAAPAQSGASATSGNGIVQGQPKPLSTNSLSETLRSYNVENVEKLTFLEPRGLVNTGNMCYMNSILQVLIFCVPFYELLDQVKRKAVHSFKSNTPLLQAMIMFMNEYNVIDQAPSVEKLRLRLKNNELEQYGEPFSPEYVYDAIKHIPRFSSMRRGQQQDAEEFLGLLLEVLHVEFMSLFEDSGTNASSTQPNGHATPPKSADSSNSDGWMEVGRNQRSAVTQSSGASATSPITKVFGGALRSQFSVPGNKMSVTLTPYQQLQLDINDPSITNITQALKGLAKSERVEGKFATSRGSVDHGNKQSFIEDLPPMLILHLKRFQYDSVSNSTQKIWKRVGYPLDLEIPKEVFTSSKRIQYNNRRGPPQYRLTSVVYHHGKFAGGGHYTVDIRRQEGREWIRLDDTLIRRVRAEDVANEGGEEDPKVLAAALERHKREQQKTGSKTGNPYILDEEDVDGNLAGTNEDGDEEGWSQVSSNGITSPPASSAGNKKWSGVVTNGVTGTNSGGTATPTGKQTPRGAKGSKGLQATTKDRVAYILLYERISG